MRILFLFFCSIISSSIGLLIGDIENSQVSIFRYFNNFEHFSNLGNSFSIFPLFALAGVLTIIAVTFPAWYLSEDNMARNKVSQRNLMRDNIPFEVSLASSCYIIPLIFILAPSQELWFTNNTKSDLIGIVLLNCISHGYLNGSHTKYLLGLKSGH